MKSIETKYHGPTNTRGSRVSATDCGDHRISVSYDDALSSEMAHRKAAVVLAKRLGWTGELVQGATKAGYVFVFTDSPCFKIEEQGAWSASES